MNGINKVILLATVGKDPLMRYTAGGTAVTNFSCATTERWGTGDEKKDKTEWHRVTCWGKTAEFVGEYVKKGCKVYVEGKLQTRSWDDDNGKKCYMTEINALNVQIIYQKRKEEAAADDTTGELSPLTDDDLPF